MITSLSDKMCDLRSKYKVSSLPKAKTETQAEAKAKGIEYRA
jgi:hypothetical protein